MASRDRKPDQKSLGIACKQFIEQFSEQFFQETGRREGQDRTGEV